MRNDVITLEKREEGEKEGMLGHSKALQMEAAHMTRIYTEGTVPVKISPPDQIVDLLFVPP